MTNSTKVERKSEREVIISRTINAPVRIVYDAWTNADLFSKWWVPKSVPMTLLSCEMDVRVGGTYRLNFKHAGGEMAFFGTYLEVTPNSRIVWTNEEGGPDSPITTVTFEDQSGKTLVVVSERHSTKESLDEALATSLADGMTEQFNQLDEFVMTLPTD
jgi:uncharacterized protein YndB with AHSA1/START domain